MRAELAFASANITVPASEMDPWWELRTASGSRVGLSAELAVWPMADWPASGRLRVGLWRRSGSSRVEGVIGRCALRLVERGTLIGIVVEQVDLLVSETCRSDGWWSRRDPEVVQNPLHG